MSITDNDLVAGLISVIGIATFMYALLWVLFGVKWLLVG